MARRYDEINDTSHRKHILIVVAGTMRQRYVARLINDRITCSSTVLIADQSPEQLEKGVDNKSRFAETYVYYLKIVDYVLDLGSSESTETELIIVNPYQEEEIIKQEVTEFVSYLEGYQVIVLTQDITDDQPIIKRAIYSGTKALRIIFSSKLTFERSDEICCFISKWFVSR